MKNNKKTTALATSILLLFIFGVFLLPMAKATETYTTTEEYITTKDTFISNTLPDENFGNYPIWRAGIDFSGYPMNTTHIALFGFNLSNKPENTIKVQVKVPINPYTLNPDQVMILFMVGSGLSWDENSITWNNAFDQLSFQYMCFKMGLFTDSISYVYYLIDITLYATGNEITLKTEGYYSEIADFLQGYTKEGDPSLALSIIYTIEHEIIPPQTNEVLFLIVGLIIGLVIGLVAVSVVMILNKRKAKI